MTRRRVRAVPADALARGVAAIRAELELPADFPPAVHAEAEAAVRDRRPGERLDVGFVTVDPPGARDLDQALHVEPHGDGHRVRYAIADVAAFVRPGGAIDAEAHARGVTVYLPDAKVPLHPPALSEGAASLLPGQWTPAVVWTLDLDGTGELVATDVRRADVRSVAQHTYGDVPAAVAAPLEVVGERRLALERARGGVRLPVPEQEVERDVDGWRTGYRVPLPAEEWGAQLSLLTGMAAAGLMLGGGVGILRTQPAPGEDDLQRLRREAVALGVDWPAGLPYPELVRRLDLARPGDAALAQAATGLSRGAVYSVVTDGDRVAPGLTPTLQGSERPHRRSAMSHWAVAAAYAHATAPLRRLQDRFVSECCLALAADEPVPAWAREGLAALPAAMAAGTRRANAAERAVVDLVEALLLQGREGEAFPAVVVDDGLVQLAEPAVRAKVAKGVAPGTPVTVRLDAADPDARRVTFSVV